MTEKRASIIIGWLPLKTSNEWGKYFIQSQVVPRDFISSFYDKEDYQGDGIFCFKREIIIYSTRVAPREILVHLKKPPSLKVVMGKRFYHKNRYIC